MPMGERIIMKYKIKNHHSFSIDKKDLVAAINAYLLAKHGKADAVEIPKDSRIEDYAVSGSGYTFHWITES